jgi:hypothetical protein
MFRKPLLGWSVFLGLTAALGSIFASTYVAMVLLFGAILIANALFVTLGMKRWTL